MINVTLSQALDLWTQLEEARHGASAFGGHTCEIYLYTLMRFSPSLMREHDTSKPGYVGENIREAYEEANTTLHDLLALFAKKNNVRVRVDGKELGPWLKTARNTNRLGSVGGGRVHVHIPPREKA